MGLDGAHRQQGPAGMTVFLGVGGGGDGAGGAARGWVRGGWPGQAVCLQSHAGIRGCSLSNKSLSHRSLNIPLK